jgi:two-component system sensor histidine kinase TctE
MDVSAARLDADGLERGTTVTLRLPLSPASEIPEPLKAG